MKNYLAFLAVALMIIVTAGCGNRLKNSEVAAESMDTLTVDELLMNPEKHLNSIVTVDGQCVHRCHGNGSIIYVGSGSDTLLLRCSATAPIGGAFGDSLVGRPTKFTGMIREERFSEDGVRDLEEQYAMHLQILTEEELPDTLLFRCSRRCVYNRRYRGQSDISDFEQSIKDYRARIKARRDTENKDYLSFYYLETIAVE